VISQSTNSVTSTLFASAHSLLRNSIGNRSAATQFGVREILLHIGLAKTGTTSIQQYCFESRHELRRQGILYPLTGLCGPGHQLLGLASLTSVQTRRDVDRPPSKNFDGLRDDMLNEFRVCDGDVDRILLSSERFGILTNRACKRLRRRLRSFHIRPILYLRRQDALAESMHSQAYRVRSTAFRPENLLLPSKRTFRFHTLAKQWQKIFGYDNLIVRRFNKNKPGQGDIVSSFLTAIETDDSLRAETNYHLNTRLSRDALEYLHHHTSLIYGSDAYYAVESKLIDYSRANPTPPEHRSFFSPTERLKLLEAHEPGNAQVAREFFGVDQLFDEPYPSESDLWERYPGLADHKIKEITAFIQS